MLSDPFLGNDWHLKTRNEESLRFSEFEKSFLQTFQAMQTFMSRVGEIIFSKKHELLLSLLN